MAKVSPIKNEVQKGKKLDFEDYISSTFRDETKFLSLIGTGKAEATKFEWLEDELDKPRSEGYAECADADDEDGSQPDELSNVTQIFRRTIKLSGTSNAVSLYGRRSELQYQLDMRGKEIRRDREYAYLNNGDAVVKEAGDKGRKTAGFTGKELLRAENILTMKADKSDMESQIQAAGRLLWNTGGKPTTLMCNVDMSEAISALQQKQSERLRVFNNEKAVITEVNSFTTAVGQTLKVVYNDLMPASTIYMFNPSDYKDKVLRRITSEPLAKNGDCIRYMLISESGLQVRNRAYSAAIKPAAGGDAPKS